MNLVLGAIALAVASPAAAQTAPADPHAGHAQHPPAQDHSRHQPQDDDHKRMDCCKDGQHCACCKDMGDGKAKGPDAARD